MVSKEELKTALINLGIATGMTLEVHSSLSSFGELEGGALTVIDTLKDIVTEEGSMPYDINKIYPPYQWFMEVGHPPVKAWYTIQEKAYNCGLIKES